MRTRDWARVRGEAILWAVPASLVGAFAFRWFGIAVGAAVGLGHVLVARREETAPRVVVVAWHLAMLPAIAGTVLAGTPWELWIIAVPLFLGIWLATRVPRRLRFNQETLPARAGALLVLALTMFVCSWLPVKAMDEKVGPAEYRGVTLKQLSELISEDHRLFFCVYDDDHTEQTTMDFEIPRRMSKRAVLEKLARESGLELHIGYCGNGASILWGAAPMAVGLMPHPVEQGPPR